MRRGCLNGLLGWWFGSFIASGDCAFILNDLPTLAPDREVQCQQRFEAVAVLGSAQLLWPAVMINSCYMDRNCQTND